jgi:predicted transcriptional regulator
VAGDDSQQVTGDPARADRRASGELEAEILAILREAAGPLTPGEVRQRLGGQGPAGQPGDQQAAGQPRGELSYSTVVTIVSRLHAKGVVARQRARRGFSYMPLDEASLAANRMSQLLGSERDHDAVLSRFVSGLSSRDTRLLRELLADDAEQAADGPQPADGQG